MATLTAELLEQRLAAHRAWQERFIDEDAPLPKASFFEVAENLGIPEDRWPKSRILRAWVRRNKDRCYVPEKLLRTWGMTVNDDFPERLERLR